MMVRKILLLAGAAVIALALAVPVSGAEDEYWWYDHEVTKGFPSAENPKDIEPVATLSTTVGGMKFGDCLYVFFGTMWNEEGGVGVGEFESANASGKCPTSIPGCEVLNSTPIGFPWTFKLNAAKEVEVSGIEVETHLSEGCKPLPLTTTTLQTGPVKGEFVDAVEISPENWEKGTVDFKEAEGLATGGQKAKLDGSVEFGTQVTAVFPE